MTEFDSSRPMDKSEIIDAWREVSNQLTTTFSGYSAEEFSAEQTGWSDAQNLDHLITSAKAVTDAMALPKFLLRVLFAASSQSRTSDEVKSADLAKLEQGFD